MSTTLLPCAHCGSPAEFETDENQGQFGGEYIQCTNAQCGMATLMMFALKEPVEEKLAEIWNARAEGELLEALQEALHSLDALDRFMPSFLNAAGVTEEDEDWIPLARKRAASARAAIAKAKGEAS